MGTREPRSHGAPLSCESQCSLQGGLERMEPGPLQLVVPRKVGAGTLIPGRPRPLQDEGGSPWATFGTSRLFRTILRTDETCSTRNTCWQCWTDQWGWGAGRPVLLLEGLSGVSPGVGSAQLCHMCCLWVKRPLQNQSRQIGKQTSRLKLGDDHSP